MKMLKPRVAMLRTSSVRPMQTERLRGSSWMRIIDRIMRRDNGLCQCSECKASGRALIAHQVDHIVELADGGSNADANLQAINAECHVRKTNASNAARRSPGLSAG